MSKLEIRAGRSQDIPAILHCLHEAFAPYKDQYTPAAFEDTVLDASRLEKRMEAMHVIVAIVNGQLVGTVSGTGSGDGEGHLRGMAVLPAQRGTGVAQELLSAIEKWLRGSGCARVTLDTTLPLLPAMRFYEKNGYRKSRVTDFFGMELIEYEKTL